MKLRVRKTSALGEFAIGFVFLNRKIATVKRAAVTRHKVHKKCRKRSLPRPGGEGVLRYIADGEVCRP